MSTELKSYRYVFLDDSQFRFAGRYGMDEMQIEVGKLYPHGGVLKTEAEESWQRTL